MAPNGPAREVRRPFPQGHAQRLTGARRPPTLPSLSPDLRTLTRTLAQEYRELVGKRDEEEAWSFLAAKLGEDRAVTLEVWETLHRGGLGARDITPRNTGTHFPSASSRPCAFQSCSYPGKPPGHSVGGQWGQGNLGQVHPGP